MRFCVGWFRYAVDGNNTIWWFEIFKPQVRWGVLEHLKLQFIFAMVNGCTHIMFEYS